MQSLSFYPKISLPMSAGFYHLYPKDGQGNIFSLFVSPRRRRGYPSRWSQVPSQPLVPCQCWGVPPIPRSLPSLWSHVFSGGTPWDRGTSSQDWSTPLSHEGGTPHQARTRVPPLQQVTLRAVRLVRFPAEGLSCFCFLVLFG